MLQRLRAPVDVYILVGFGLILALSYFIKEAIDQKMGEMEKLKQAMDSYMNALTGSKKDA